MFVCLPDLRLVIARTFVGEKIPLSVYLAKKFVPKIAIVVFYGLNAGIYVSM